MLARAVGAFRSFALAELANLFSLARLAHMVRGLVGKAADPAHGRSATGGGMVAKGLKIAAGFERVGGEKLGDFVLFTADLLAYVLEDALVHLRIFNHNHH